MLYDGMYCMFLIRSTVLPTCDLPNCAEHVELFWVQSFNVVIDIPVNDNGRSERIFLITAMKNKLHLPTDTTALKIRSVKHVMFA